MHRKTIVKNPISFEFLWKNTGDVCFELVSVIFMFQSVSSVDVANRKSVCACAPLKKYFFLICAACKQHAHPKISSNTCFLCAFIHSKHPAWIVYTSVLRHKRPCIDTFFSSPQILFNQPGLFFVIILYSIQMIFSLFFMLL